MYNKTTNSELNINKKDDTELVKKNLEWSKLTELFIL